MQHNLNVIEAAINVWPYSVICHRGGERADPSPPPTRRLRTSTPDPSVCQKPEHAHVQVYPRVGDNRGQYVHANMF